MFKNFLFVAIGGALGSMLRFGITHLIGKREFPYATISINIVGSFIIGILFGLSLRSVVSDYNWKLLAVGFCGGFTTFSAYSLDNLLLLQQQRYLLFLLYILGSIIAGLFATYVGFVLSK